MAEMSITIHCPELALLAEALKAAVGGRNVLQAGPAAIQQPQPVPQQGVAHAPQQAPVNPTIPAQPMPMAPRTAPGAMNAPYAGAPAYPAPAGNAPGAPTPYPSNPAQPYPQQPQRAPLGYPQQYPGYPAPAAPIAPQAPAMPPAPPIQTPQLMPQAPVAAAPTYKPEDLARAAASIMDAGKDPLVLLAQFGAHRFEELKPEQYGAFATALRGMGARI